MRGKATALFAVFLVVPSVVTFVRLSEAASNTSDYKLVKKITLGGEGGWDYFGVDPSYRPRLHPTRRSYSRGGLQRKAACRRRQSA